MLKHLTRFFLWQVAVLPAVFATGFGFDVGLPPEAYAQALDQAGLDGRAGTWMRVRGVAGVPGVPLDATRSVTLERAGLLALRDKQIKTLVILRWESASWPGSVRQGQGQRLPLDLRDAYERGRWLGVTYGDVVDGWEIENEPDIDFVQENPETYTAFLKAIYLGLKSGAGEGAKLRGETARLSGQKPAQREFGSQSLVVMGAPALPPGPFFERLWANGLSSYTDGFNYHYYGYAEDFGGVYRQFETAVKDLGANDRKATYERATRLTQKRWPVFISEYGYGLLDADARNTVEGRVRQWRWFATVGQQIKTLRPEGPMVFLINPYYERGINEFGLTMAEQPRVTRTFGSIDNTGKEAESASVVSAGEPSVLSFAPAVFRSETAAVGRTPVGCLFSDLRRKSSDAWMARIGQRFGDHFASPALAYLWGFAENNAYTPQAWSVWAEPPSSVVIDFIADAGLNQWKSGGGYLLEAENKAVREGRGRVVVYNFSKQAVTGRLCVDGQAEQTLVLAPGERREVPVQVTVNADRFVGREWRVVFNDSKPQLPRSQWVTRLYPPTDDMEAKVSQRFNFPALLNRVNTEALLARPLAEGEPAAKPQGRWLVTDGVRVEETAEGWQFHVDYLPAEALRPAVVELPLPSRFKIEPDALLSFERRQRAGAPADTLPAGVAAERFKSRAGQAGAMMEVYIRMENGNLYQTWPRLTVTESWKAYIESIGNFTPAFFGRAELPWRFAENKPASLVFFLRPEALPTVFEVRDVRLARLSAQK